MTKKDFRALAAALLGEKLRVQQSNMPGTVARYQQWEADVNAVADVCARSNPRFDRARFLKACGVKEV